MLVVRSSSDNLHNHGGLLFPIDAIGAADEPDEGQTAMAEHFFPMHPTAWAFVCSPLGLMQSSRIWYFEDIGDMRASEKTWLCCGLQVSTIRNYTLQV